MVSLAEYAASLGAPGSRPAVPTTVAISRGSRAGTGSQSQSDRLLAYIGQAALKAGLGAEGARAAQAIAVTEGGLTGAVGDLSGGGSYGPFQFYAQGQLPNYAASIGRTPEQAKAIIAQRPEAAIDWALRGYLGAAIKRGLDRGLRGPDLATFAQRTGQVSESPERAGQNYTRLFAQPGGSPASAPAPAPTAPGQQAYGRDLVPYQFGPDQQLTAQEAASACGPAAAIAFARRFGRNPTMREAVELAKTVGWTEAGGMNGLQNQERLIRALAERQGVEMPVRGEYGSVNWDNVVHDAMQGNPVTVSTNVHYYVIDGYDPETRRFHVGNSGLARKAINKTWATAEEITAADGAPNGALYVEDPRVPGKSVATRPATTARGDDWRLSARPTVNRGYQPWMDELPATTPVSGDLAPLPTGGYTWQDEDAAAPPWNPYESPAWRAARAIDEDFWSQAAANRERFEQDVFAPTPRPRASAVAWRPRPAYESVFGAALDPRQGVPFLDAGFRAPDVRGF